MSLTVTTKVRFNGGSRGRKRLEETTSPTPDVPAGRVPRISRLMALAIHMDGLIRDGHVRDFAELARLAHVSRARISQVMNLLNLAPDIQEEILSLPLVQSGRDPIREHTVRPMTAVLDWTKQRRMWRALFSS